MPNNDLTRLLLFNDGEGLTHDDLNDLQQLLLDKVISHHIHGGAFLGRSQSSLLAKTSSEGADPFGPGLPSQADLYSPFIMNGIIRPFDNGGGLPVQTVGSGAFVLENGLLTQRTNPNTPGTAFAESPIMLTMALDDEERTMGDDITANPAPGAGNPRWDTWGVRIGYGTDDNSESRDFKDAITGALSTSVLNKRRRLILETEFVTGPQSATFDMATLSAGFVPLMTLRRPVGEVTSAISVDDIYYHVYPMRLGVEDVMGQDLFYEGVTGSAWDRDVFGRGSLVKGPAGSEALYAVPRTIDGSKRIVAVGVLAADAGNDFSVEIGRYRYSATTGLPTFTSLVDLDAGSGVGNINGSQDGFQMNGEAQWSPTTAKRLPIWGNGTHRGPLFNQTRFGGVPASNTAGLDKLAVRLDPDGNWSSTAEISLVRFYYLY